MTLNELFKITRDLRNMGMGEEEVYVRREDGTGDTPLLMIEPGDGLEGLYLVGEE